MKTAEEYSDDVTKLWSKFDWDEINFNQFKNYVKNYIEQAQKESYHDGQSSPKIKQLEWVRYSYGREISETPIGNFYIDVPNHGKIRMSLVEAFCGYFDSVAEAKSQAQKIFERRVKKCLE